MVQLVSNKKEEAALPPPPPPTADTPTQADANKQLLDGVLGGGAGGTLMRALGESCAVVRAAAMRAGLRMVRGASAAQASDLLDAFEELLDAPPAGDAARAERVTAAVLALSGELGGKLAAVRLAPLLARFVPKFSDASELVATAAADGMGVCLRGAIAAGTATVKGEASAAFQVAMQLVAKAKSPADALAGALAVGAVGGGAGPAALTDFCVVGSLTRIIGLPAGKDAPNAREAAVLSVERLAVQMGTCAFEAHSVPLTRVLVGLYADKDKKVADAAVRAVRSILSRLSPLSVKLVLPALYDGMEGVAWRPKVECLEALALLAKHAPSSVGPRLPDAIPKVMECLASTNARVMAAASEALPVLCATVDNPETQKLKPLLIEAFVRPDTTLACLEELLCTTFVNAMDATSLAFIMPLLLRGLTDPKYELVKKAAVSAGNVCALVKNGSDIAPFVPDFMPLLQKQMADHPSPDVRAECRIAYEKLVEGAGELFDVTARPRATAASLRAGLEAAYPQLAAVAVSFVADTAAELLEQELGGAIKPSLLAVAPAKLAAWIAPRLEGREPSSAGALEALCEATVGGFRELLSERAKSTLTKTGGKDYALDVQNAILAFAGRVLLRGCDLQFERGHRYGLVGANGVGKTTLLNRLAAKDITGFPQQLKTWYIRHEVVCEDGVDVLSFVETMAPDSSEAAVIGVLDDVGFPPKLQATSVAQLSGGWKMKLSIAISILHQPELLLLDEPTNHLDSNAVRWLTAHLNSLTGVTIAVVSHDYDFLDDVCTDVAHYESEKPGDPCHLNYYPFGFKEFQKLKPEIAAGLPTGRSAARVGGPAGGADEAGGETPTDGGSVAGESTLSAAGTAEEGFTLSKVEAMVRAGQILPINFPDPGKPDGVRTYRKPILVVENTNFRYPGTEKMVLTKASATVTLGSRAVLLGANGAGKSTFLKIIVGDLEVDREDNPLPKPNPNAGVAERKLQEEKGTSGVWKHHNLRVSYIAQHSLHHLEDYLESTPMAYIQERFRQGLDKEVSKLKTLQLTDEEREAQKGIGQVTDVVGRQMKGKHLWYEFTKNGRKGTDTKWVPLEEVEREKSDYKPYVRKLIKNFDEKQMALDSGMAIRPITSAEILAHLEDFGVYSALAHGKVKQMSSGQRQRLVLSAAFWSKPHLIALDEPTNYLDNDTLAALTQALKTFKGAVVTVSHNEAFVSEISNEKWIVEDGQITCIQLRDAKAR